jgi:hypothetical protein
MLLWLQNHAQALDPLPLSQLSQTLGSWQKQQHLATTADCAHARVPAVKTMATAQHQLPDRHPTKHFHQHPPRRQTQHEDDDDDFHVLGLHHAKEHPARFCVSAPLRPLLQTKHLWKT